ATKKAAKTSDDTPARRYPRLSTPLMVATPPDDSDSYLFGPFEPDDSIKENRALSSTGRANRLSFSSYASDTDEDPQSKSPRIYIGTKRLRQLPTCSPTDEADSRSAALKNSSINSTQSSPPEY